MPQEIVVQGDTFGEGWGKQNAMNTELYAGRETAFTDADLTANVLTIGNGNAVFYDNNGAQVSVDITRVSASSFTIDFGAAITGTWIWVV